MGFFPTLRQARELIIHLHFHFIFFDRTPADEHFFLFIPQTEVQRFQAVSKRKRLNLEDRVLVVTFLQFVIGDLRAEVVNMMETNIAGKPLQHFGKFIERTAVHASLEELPILVALPVGRLKVMLNIE